MLERFFPHTAGRCLHVDLQLGVSQLWKEQLICSPSWVELSELWFSVQLCLSRQPPIKVLGVVSGTPILTGGDVFAASGGAVMAGRISTRGNKEWEFCSNRGDCDEETGVCNCYLVPMPGYRSSDGCGNVGVRGDCGAANDKNKYGGPIKSCVGELACSGHGYCTGSPSFRCVCAKKAGRVAIAPDLSLEADVDSPLLRFDYGVDPNSAQTCDRDSVLGCKCDSGYEGYNCSQRSCPRGDDPATTGQVDEIQLLKCIATGGTFQLLYRTSFSADIPFDATPSTLRDILIASLNFEDVVVKYSVGQLACSPVTATTKNVIKIMFPIDHSRSALFEAQALPLALPNGNVRTRTKAGEYGQDGSLMRIEVISMLKLAFVTLLGALFLTLVTLIGYGGAPAVSRSDCTSNPTRCTSDFSLALFEECSKKNVTISSQPEDAGFNVSGSVLAIDEVLRLPLDEQIPVLSCMFNACTSTTGRPVISNSADQLQVAHYSFGLNGFQHHNRLLRKPDERQQNFSRDHSRQQTLTVECEEGGKFCESQYFLRFGEIDFSDYQVDVLFNSSVSLPINGTNPQFKKTWGTESFTNWLIGIKVSYSIISGFVAFWYNVSLGKLSAREQNLEQGWVAAITVTLIFFNDPFYVVEANYGGNPVKILSLLFQVTFFQMLLLFWLIMLDNLRLQGKMNGVSNSQFFTPKITNNDPTWDPLEKISHYALAQALCAAMSVFYVFWVAYLVLLSHQEIRSRRVRYRYFVLLNFFMVIMSFIGLGIGAISPAPSSGGQWTLFQTLFNVYIYAIAYLYAPSSTALKTAKKRAQDNGNMDPEASPVLGKPVHPVPIDVNDVATGGLDLA
ncbi:Transmembrane protein, partial [Globisporangium splendens]